MNERPLKDCIAIVTRASRGADRGIAQELGVAGATVYVTSSSGRNRRCRLWLSSSPDSGPVVGLTLSERLNQENMVQSSCGLTFVMRDTTRLAGACPLDARG